MHAILYTPTHYMDAHGRKQKFRAARCCCLLLLVAISGDVTVGPETVHGAVLELGWLRRALR